MSTVRDWQAAWQAAMDQPIEPTNDEKRHAAALTVAEYAHDADDARDLLAMLGLEGA